MNHDVQPEGGDHEDAGLGGDADPEGVVGQHLLQRREQDQEHDHRDERHQALALERAGEALEDTEPAEREHGRHQGEEVADELARVVDPHAPEEDEEAEQLDEQHQGHVGGARAALPRLVARCRSVGVQQAAAGHPDHHATHDGHPGTGADLADRQALEQLEDEQPAQRHGGHAEPEPAEHAADAVVAQGGPAQCQRAERGRGDRQEQHIEAHAADAEVVQVAGQGQAPRRGDQRRHGPVQHRADDADHAPDRRRQQRQPHPRPSARHRFPQGGAAGGRRPRGRGRRHQPPTRSPSSPVGRNTSTRMSTPKANTSCHCPPR